MVHARARELQGAGGGVVQLVMRVGACMRGEAGLEASTNRSSSACGQGPAAMADGDVHERIDRNWKQSSRRR